MKDANGHFQCESCGTTELNSGRSRTECGRCAGAKYECLECGLPGVRSKLGICRRCDGRLARAEAAEYVRSYVKFGY